MQIKVIFAIVLIGLFLRIVDITNNSLYGDELTIALDANSILKTGKDQLGNTFPLTFPMGLGRPAGYVYGSVPFIGLFGPSELGVRSLSILSGVGIIVLFYLLGGKLFSKKVGLLASAVAAVSPWNISLSRGGFEAHFALFLALLATYFFLKAKDRSIFYIFSGLLFGLTLHTYPTYKLSLIFFIPLLFRFFIKDQRKGINFICGVVIFSILVALSVMQTFTAGSEKRFTSINIFSNEKILNSIEQKINYEREINTLPSQISKFFHNKPVEYVKIFGENYLQNFSLDFLLLHGDRNPRHNMATMGGLYFVELFLIFFGLISLIKNRKILIFLILWLILSPIPTALIDTPHALRSSFMLPPLVLLSALGLTNLWEKRLNKVLIIIFLLFVIQFAFFIQKLYFLAPNEYARFWSDSAKIASKIALENRESYKYVVLSDGIDNIEFAYPAYAEINPLEIISQNEKRSSLGDYKFKKFDNVYIGYIPDGEIENFINLLDGSVLFIGPSDNHKVPSNFEEVFGRDKSKTLILKRKGE